VSCSSGGCAHQVASGEVGAAFGIMIRQLSADCSEGWSELASLARLVIARLYPAEPRARERAGMREVGELRGKSSAAELKFRSGQVARAHFGRPRGVTP
jgi:hypothetical protein